MCIRDRTIYEPGLDLLVKKNLEAKRLSFSSDLSKYIRELDVIFVAVDTPTRSTDGQADLENLFSAIDKIISLSNNRKILVIKSTVPVGTNQKIRKRLSDTKLYKGSDIVSNPEFLREGSAIEDFMKPDRVVIGTTSNRIKKVMGEIYKPLYLRDFPILYTCLLYTSPSPRDATLSRMPSSA